MNTELEIKELVKEKYGRLATQSKLKMKKSCCGSSSSLDEVTVFGDNYKNLDGYVADADLGLGCGLPTEFANIHKGDIVVDLGSGAGNDVFVARSFVGNDGKVIGIDMTEEMIAKANKNLIKVGYNNVEFKLGEIEKLPVDNNTADVVISNCVLNLVPDKQKAFSEIFRILKPNGHFCISDIVLKGEIPEYLKKSAELYAGCVAGALQKDIYLDIISKTGFQNVEVVKTKLIELPEDILKSILNEDLLNQYKNSSIGIFSITVVGYKK